MPDFKVTFRGDLGNLHQFDSAVRNSALSSARAIEAANQKIASSVGQITGAYSSNAGAGLFVQKQRSIADAVNNTFKQSGNIVRRYVSDYTTEIQKINGQNRTVVKPLFDEAYQGSFQKAIGNIHAYETALDRLKNKERELLGIRRQAAGRTAVGANIRRGLDERQFSLEEQLKADTGVTTAQTIVKDAAARNAAAQAALLATPKGTRGITQLRVQAKAAAADLAASQRELDRVLKPYTDTLNRIDSLRTRLDARDTRIGERRIAGEGRVLQSPLYRDLDAALNATPPIQADLARALGDSPELQKRLLKQGLGAGAQPGTLDFQRALAAQEAQVSSYTRNLRTNVRTIAGEFKDASGLVNRFTVDVDEQGKVIGRWGGQLSGAGNVLRQTVRDFQKVIEWTVATTVVFGTLATVVGQLQNINELNTALTRFSITAQTSVAETRDLFQQLSQVAFDTATPLNEIITVADDIALATRNANQSTEEWHSSIVDLTTAVGIFTNLTGKDTVAAADQLSSAFKQLGIAPSELVGLLNKVTAVAGGQSNAIADIVQSIAGLAEAAKAAGFSVDEQIAGVQVLAQVTNKTSAEIATSFKNLFGSVSSVGSEKILAEFGIQVRDAEGGIRDFLDIYRDVADALEKGIIPQNRLPDVLRGISGGPRRAPDAAALLANLPRIDEVILKSQNATNEALVANAKILTTNQAKITQFQNSVDAAVFERFGEAVRNLTDILTTLGITLATMLQGVNPEITTAVLQIGLLVTGLLTFQKVLSFLGVGAFVKNLGSMAAGIKNVGQAATTAIPAVQRLADERALASGLIVPNGVTTFKPGEEAERLTRRQRLGNFVGGNRFGLAGAGIGAAVGGVAGLSGGANPVQALGTALQVGGGLATLSGALAPFGVAAIVAGTAIQFMAGNTDKAKQSAADLSEEVYTLTQRIKDTNVEVDGYAKQQQKALKTIQALKDDTSRTVEEQLRLADATTQYVTSTLALADANQRVSEIFDELIAKIPNLEAKYQSLLGTARLNPRDPLIQTLQQQLATDILRGSGQSIYSGQRVPVASTFIAPRSGESRDLTEVLNDPEKLLQLLAGNLNPSQSVKGGRPEFVPRTETEINVIRSALEQLITRVADGTSTLSQEQLDRLIAVVTEFTAVTSSFAQNSIALTQQAALIQAKIITGEFQGAQAANATLANTVASRLNQATGSPSPTADGFRRQDATGPTSLDRAAELIQNLNAAAETGAAVATRQLVDAATTALKLEGTYNDLRVAGDAALNQGIILWLQEAGVAQEILDQLAKQYNVTLNETITTNDALIQSLDQARKSAAETYGKRQLQLEIAQNSGDFEGNAEGLAILRSQNEQAYESTLQLIEGIGQLSEGAFVDLNNSLSEVIGLQGLHISQTELETIGTMEASEQAAFFAQKQSELAAELIENAVAAGVNAEGIRKITEQVGILLSMPSYKQIIVEVTTLYKTRLGPQGGFQIPPSLAQEFNKAITEEKKAEAERSKITNQINDIIRRSSGTNLGQLSNTAARKAASGSGGSTAYNKPGLLDVPDEIADAANRNALLKQAVDNAKKLQSIVPGETKQNRGEIVELLDGTRRLLETRGVGEEYLRRAMDELTEQIKKQNELLTKADTVRRLRVGAAGFASIANVPFNARSGVSVGGPSGPIDVSLNLNGTVLTPAQFSQFADLVAASIKRQLTA